MQRIEKDQLHEETEGLFYAPGIADWLFSKVEKKHIFWKHNFERDFPKTMFLKRCDELQENYSSDFHKFFFSYR